MPRAEVAPLVRHRRELRRYQQGAFVLAALALVAGAALLPRGDELLLIHVKNRQIIQARELLAEAAGHNVSSAASVVAHHELYLLEGRVDEALAEMEEYTRNHPDDAAAWKRLMHMYADAQRLDERLDAAERVYRLEPTAEMGRQLVTLYRWSGEEEAEAAILRELVRSDAATADESVRSARIEAAFGRAAAALDALERLRRRQPGAFDYPAVELYASLLLETGGPARLAGPLQLLPIAQDGDVLPQLARTFLSWGRPDAAVGLFATPPGTIAPPERLALRARIAVGTAEARAVARELVARDADEPLPPTVVGDLVTLLLSLPDYVAIGDVLVRHHGDAETAVQAAIGHAVAHRRRDLAQALIARLGDDSLADSPMLALDLAVERGDVASAERWIARIDGQGQTTAEQAAALAQFESRLGLTGRAFGRLVSVVKAPAAPAWAFADFGGLAVTLGREDEALGLLSTSTARGAREAWARLAVMAGRTADIENWLRAAHPPVLDPRGLRDLYFLLADHGHAGLAARVANHLLDDGASDADRVLAARAWLAANRPVEALVPLRTVMATNPRHPEAQATYDAALLSALQSGVGVSDELRRVFLARLADRTVSVDRRTILVEGLWSAGERGVLFDEIARLASTDIDRWLSPLVEAAIAAARQPRAIELVAAAIPPVRSGGAADPSRAGAAIPQRHVDLVRALMALGAPDDVLLPQLEYLANTEGETWIYAYDERLTAPGRAAQRIQLWTAVGHDGNLARGERRAAVSRLVELGAIGPATEILRDLVSASEPSDPDVTQLISLWGDHPTSAQLTWLMARAAGAAADRAAWLQHVLRAGGAEGARRIVAAWPNLPAEAAPAMVETWIDAHNQASSTAVMREVLMTAIARPPATTRELRHAGRVALAREWPDVAALAFTGVAARQPEDLEALRWLGALAFSDGRAGRAGTWLDAYLAAGGHEPEPLYLLGELARNAGHDDRALGYFERARRELESAGPAAARHPLLANVLVRLDDRRRATTLFAALLDDDPSADHVRADYVAALLQWGDYDRAGDVLALTPGSHDPEPAPGAAGSGARRLALLEIQWLTRSGRYGDALQLLDQLGDRFPLDPDVLLARAAFDSERGLEAVAGRLYERAFREAPDREDVNRLVQQRRRQQAPQVAFESATRSISSGWDERSERLAASGRLRGRVPFAMSLERLRVTAAQLRRSDGAVAPVDTDLTRLDATVTWPLSDAVDVAGALFGTSRGAGAGVTFSQDDLRGRTEVLAEAGRPFWEFLEGIADDGRRDRMSAQRQLRLRPDTGAWAQVAWNRYRLGSGAAVQTTGLTLGLVRTVRQAAPAITVQYGLDKEHRLSATLATAADGSTFNPIPFASREVHLLGAIGRFGVGRFWDVETTAGYTLDRFGGRGTFLTAKATPPAAARAGVSLWIDRRLFTMATTQQVVRLGAQVMVRLEP